MKLSSRKTGVTGKICIFESHKPILIFPSLSISIVNELLRDTSWVQHPVTWGEKSPSAQERPLGAERQEELLSLWATARLQRLQSILPCNIVRFIFRSYQQFTVGCSLLSKIHPSISWHGHIPTYTEVTVQLC